MDGALLIGIGKALLGGDEQETIAGIQLHRGHIALLHQFHELTVINFHLLGLVHALAHVGAAHAENERQHQRPQHQPTDALPVAVVPAASAGVFVFVRVHLVTPFGSLQKKEKPVTGSLSQIYTTLYHIYTFFSRRGDGFSVKIL